MKLLNNFPKGTYWYDYRPVSYGTGVKGPDRQDQTVWSQDQSGFLTSWSWACESWPGPQWFTQDHSGSRKMPPQSQDHTVQNVHSGPQDQSGIKRREHPSPRTTSYTMSTLVLGPEWMKLSLPSQSQDHRGRNYKSDIVVLGPECTVYVLKSLCHPSPRTRVDKFEFAISVLGPQCTKIKSVHRGPRTRIHRSCVKIIVTYQSQDQYG